MNRDSVILDLIEKVRQLEQQQQELAERIQRLEALTATENQQTDDENQPETEEAAGFTRTTPAMIEGCYRCAQELNTHRPENENELIREYAERMHMNMNTAVIYVYAVRCMLAGNIYKRAINKQATLWYLQKIKEDYGNQGLENALQALKKHIEYRHDCGHAVTSLEQILAEYQH